MWLGNPRIIGQGHEPDTCLMNKTICTNPPRHVGLPLIGQRAQTADGPYPRVRDITGSYSDEGTKNVSKDTNTPAEPLKCFQDQVSSVLSNTSLDPFQNTYLDKMMPLKDKLINRLVNSKASSGKLLQPLSLVQGDFHAH
ncbi:hypothetical protein MCOR25_007665 [Pyricularia grisea]|nr:hypothetical protein MCOR25_007665 [Pyricularia grisea]